MEPAKIDWKNLQWVFVEDQVYEHLNAPKWFDLSSVGQEADNPAADVAWFCRPDCGHPNTAEDFLLRKSPNSSTSKKPPNAYKTLLLGERNLRDFNIKKRVLTSAPTQSNCCVHRRSSGDDAENQNPNVSTPLNQHARSLKEAFKSSIEKKKKQPPVNELPPPRLKSTLSARNLFAGRNILNQITEFVGELKKLASRAKEREDNVEKLNDAVNMDGAADPKEEGEEELVEGSVSVEEELVEGSAKERKPLLELSKGRSDGSDMMSISKEKEKQPLHRKLNRGVGGEAEKNLISLDMENVKPSKGKGKSEGEGENILSQIRTSPPTPQCFSTTTTKKAPPKTRSRAKLVERQILGEVKQKVVSEEIEEAKEKAKEKEKGLSSNSSFDGREAAKVLDLFWLLKPCTPSS